jgi:hypothetical protein
VGSARLVRAAQHGRPTDGSHRASSVHQAHSLGRRGVGSTGRIPLLQSSSRAPQTDSASQALAIGSAVFPPGRTSSPSLCSRVSAGIPTNSSSISPEFSRYAQNRQQQRLSLYISGCRGPLEPEVLAMYTCACAAPLGYLDAPPNRESDGGLKHQGESLVRLEESPRVRELHSRWLLLREHRSNREENKEKEMRVQGALESAARHAHLLMNPPGILGHG